MLPRSAAGTLAQRSLPSRCTRHIHTFRDLAPMRAHRRQLLLQGTTVGLVPTMGALHAGHLSLIRQAAREHGKVFVSIYVNPTQFGVNEDLGSYPKTWDNDMKLLHELDEELKVQGGGRVDAVFAPATRTMYPSLPPDSTLPGTGSFVTITPLANLLEGKSRPVFFRGVATVCMKLFNAVQPEAVYFGQKDAQQTVIIKRMVKDFLMPISVRIIPTERESDGLALSSRNVYLGQRRRTVGVVLNKALRAAEAAYLSGKISRSEVLAPAWDVANRESIRQDQLPQDEMAEFEVDYISLADPESLEEVEEVNVQSGALLSGAIKMLPLERSRPGEILGLGQDKVAVRLIDNIPLPPT